SSLLSCFLVGGPRFAVRHPDCACDAGGVGLAIYQLRDDLGNRLLRALPLPACGPTQTEDLTQIAAVRLDQLDSAGGAVTGDDDLGVHRLQLVQTRQPVAQARSDTGERR